MLCHNMFAIDDGVLDVETTLGARVKVQVGIEIERIVTSEDRKCTSRKCQVRVIDKTGARTVGFFVAWVVVVEYMTGDGQRGVLLPELIRVVKPRRAHSVDRHSVVESLVHVETTVML